MQELFFFIVLFKLSLKFYFNVFKFNTKNIVCKLPVGSGPELAHPWRRIQFFLFGSATFYNGTVVCRALILMFSTGLFQEDFLNPDRRALGAAEADPLDPLRLDQLHRRIIL